MVDVYAELDTSWEMIIVIFDNMVRFHSYFVWFTRYLIAGMLPGTNLDTLNTHGSGGISHHQATSSQKVRQKATLRKSL